MKVYKKKDYDYRNWQVGDRVKMNPHFDGWHRTVSREALSKEGTVEHVGRVVIKVMWDDRVDVFYSRADASLINLSRKIPKYLLPEELFEI